LATRRLLGEAIPSSFSVCAAASAAKLREENCAGEGETDDEEEERKIDDDHSAAEEERAAAEKSIAAPVEELELELVEAPAPAAAREQSGPSAASRERDASWAAARRSIWFFFGLMGRKRQRKAATTKSRTLWNLASVLSAGCRERNVLADKCDVPCRPYEVQSGDRDRTLKTEEDSSKKSAK
jgi:hypothetical protein